MYTTDEAKGRISPHIRPTEQVFEALQRAYDVHNDYLFEGELPNCLLSLQRKPRSYGYFRFRRFVNLDGIHCDEIALNPIYFQSDAIEDVLSTLVHEMVHLWQFHFGSPGRGRYHNRQWANKMKSVGLHPSDTGERGGAELGDQMSHYIVSGGPFQRITAQLVDAGFKLMWHDDVQRLEGVLRTELGFRKSALSKPAKAGKRVKYSCPVCGLNAWAKHSAKLLCGEHRCDMIAH